MAKQKLKGYYGNIGERQFRRFYDEAMRRRGDNGENLIELLERRLETVVYRLKFAPTVFAARQFVNHGHIQVNGKRVNIGSLPVERRRPDRGAQQEQATGAGARSHEIVRARRARLSPGQSRPDEGLAFVRAPKLADVPYPVRMEPTWSSSSTRADGRDMRDEGRPFRAAFCFAMLRAGVIPCRGSKSSSSSC